VRHLVTAVVAGLLVLACNSTPTPTPVGVCALVPDMDALVGKTSLGPPGAFTLNDFDRCLWTYASTPARSVGVSVGAIRGHKGAIDNLGDGEQLTGIGDDARWWAGTHLLSVAVGQRTLQVDLQLDDADVSRDLAVSIAQAALQNLH
jgi:hypothetical protein